MILNSYNSGVFNDNMTSDDINSYTNEYISFDVNDNWQSIDNHETSFDCIYEYDSSLYARFALQVNKFDGQSLSKSVDVFLSDYELKNYKEVSTDSICFNGINATEIISLYKTNITDIKVSSITWAGGNNDVVIYTITIEADETIFDEVHNDVMNILETFKVN